MRLLRPNLPPDSPASAVGDGPTSVHLAALDESGRVIGAAVLLPNAFPAAPERDGAFQLRGMAVDPGLQRGGVGSAVLRHCMTEALARGGRLLWCNARTTAVPFYAHHGLRTSGPEFVAADTGIAHYLMWVELPADPASSVQ